MHQYESYWPHCVYMMVHSTTEPASKFKSDRFSKALEQKICKGISNEALIPLSNVQPEYNKLASAFKECLEIYSFVVPFSLVKEARQEAKEATHKFESKRANFSTQSDPKGLLAMLESYHQHNLKVLGS